MTSGSPVRRRPLDIPSPIVSYGVENPGCTYHKRVGVGLGIPETKRSYPVATQWPLPSRFVVDSARASTIDRPIAPRGKIESYCPTEVSVCPRVSLGSDARRGQ